MKNKFLCALSLFLFFSPAAKSKVKLTVHAGPYDRTDCVVSAVVKNSSPHVALFEVTSGAKEPRACQLRTENGQTSLYWILNGNTLAGTSRSFVIETNKKQQPEVRMSVADTDGNLVLKDGATPILQYNIKTVYPPKGIDTAFRRNAFFHPLWSPAGNVLTTIQPKDHYHHYGLWNPWTKVEYGGKQYDLWNLGDKTGTVRFNRILSTSQGPVFASFTVLADHYIIHPTEEKVIMDEQCSITAWKTGDSFLWDFVSVLHPSTSLPVILKAYRYAGFGYRATEEWTKENCEMMTSEGKTRQQIDGSTARWIYITGQCAKGRSGLLFLGHPENYNAPQPLRIWDENANGGRGDAFINFAPTKNIDWTLEPNSRNQLRYRVLAYDGEMTPECANRLWDDFASPPVVEIK